MRKASDRWNVVDRGSMVAASAMRARKKTCSAAAATNTSPIQRRRARIGQARVERNSASTCADWAEHATRHGHPCARHAGCRRIDDDVEAAFDRAEFRRLQFDAVLLRKRRMPLDQCRCLALRAVGDRDPSRPGFDQRPQYPGRGAARAYQQYVRAGEFRLRIEPDVVDKADAIGVVAQHNVAVEAQGIAGLRELRAGGEVGRHRR